MDIVAVCHHCGRPMCGDHSVSAEVGRGSTEFTGLELDTTLAWHCDDHDHTVDGGLRWLVVSGYLAATVGVVCLLLQAFWAGGSFVVAGAGAAVVGHVVSRRRREQAVHERPPFPVVPTIDTVSLTETVRASISFDENNGYQVTPQQPTGRLTVDMSLRKADRGRLGSYRTKYRLTPDDPVPFSAGYVVLRGPVGLQFDDARFPVPVFALSGHLPDLPFLMTNGTRNRTYQVNLTHRLRRGLEMGELPLWLTPSLVPESDRRTLELDIQWDKDFGYDGRSLEIDRINEIRLIAPVGWGAVRSIRLDEGVQADRQSFGRTRDPDDPDEYVYLIKVFGVRLPRAVKRKPKLRLTVQFEDEIDTADSIRGSLDMRFRHAVSGVSEVQVYHALGGPRRWAKGGATGVGRAVTTTKVAVDFALSLASVRYQDTRIVPDARIEEDDQKHAPVRLEHVIPNHTTIAALTDALSTTDCYVKRVVENPGSIGPRADVVCRYWDIAGRYYHLLYPIEFRITLTGEEVREGGDHAVDGTTNVAVTVRGVYANPKMKKIIEQTWQTLCQQTVKALAETTASS